jgi:RNA 3'-terminal phosphate cyclase (ATP)
VKATAKELIEIDGSHGEGGGQILRTALALSAILNKPLKVHKIRAGRKNPGLQPQHLKAVEALARITQARTEGVRIGSETIAFIPQETQPGDYRFEIGTAGSVTLLLQALLPPLCSVSGKSRLTLAGGTHVEWSPPFHYLERIFFAILRRMGITVNADLERWGWYPRGGGIIHLEVHPASEIKPLILTDRGKLMRIGGLSASSNLPAHVAERQRDYVLKEVGEKFNVDVDIEVDIHARANSPGSFVFLTAESENIMAGSSSLGRKGKRAEDVAKEAVDSLKDYLSSEGCIDPHLADQLTLFMALARGTSSFTTTKITDHLLTNLWVIQHFLDVEVRVSGELGGSGKIEISNESKSLI